METNHYRLINVGGRKMIELKDIIILRTELNSTYIYLIDGSRLLVSYTIKKLAASNFYA